MAGIIHNPLVRNKQNQLFNISPKLMFSPWETYTNVIALYFFPIKHAYISLDVCILKFQSM